MSDAEDKMRDSWLILSPVIPSDRRESRNLLSESHLPLQVEIPRFATLTRNDVPGEPE